MFKLHTLILELIVMLRPVIERIARRDPNLEVQARRALSSVALNSREGGGSQGKNQRARYFNALGSAQEVRACVEVAQAFGYIEPLDELCADRLDHVVAILWRLTH